jgi:hypothetical protein
VDADRSKILNFQDLRFKIEDAGLTTFLAGKNINEKKKKAKFLFFYQEILFY